LHDSIEVVIFGIFFEFLFNFIAFICLIINIV